jgi:hypothetical protein
MALCPRRRRARFSLLLLLLLPFLLVWRSGPSLPLPPAAPVRAAVAAPLACPASPGRGPAAYRSTSPAYVASLLSRVDGAAPRCVVRHAREGRTGNQLVNYFVGRLYGELHGCAAAPVADFGGDAGGEEAPPSPPAWPAGGGGEGALGAPVDACAAPGAPLRALLEGGGAGVFTLGCQMERADAVYAAASLGWDLGPGGSLMGGGGGGAAAPRDALREAALAARCAAWSAEREACWAERDARWLHPWTPAGVRRLAALALGAGAAAGAAAAAAAAPLPPGLRAVAASPGDTIVVHARLGDMSAMAWQEVGANAAGGHGLSWGARGGAGWAWVPERFPRYRYPAFPDCEKLRGEAAYTARGGLDMVEALELDVARTGGFVVSPLSFYEAVLGGTRGGRGGWRAVVVLTEACSADHPIVRALVERFNAVVQVGTVAEDFATLALAREVVVSGSTFSYMAAVAGRARAIHAPVAGSLALVGAHAGQCLAPPPAMDTRWVFHDVYRRAVDAADAALRGGGSPWLRRAEGAGPLPPPRPRGCPPSAPPDAVGGAHRWVHQGAPPPAPPAPGGAPPAAAAAAAAKQMGAADGGTAAVPYYFLTWEQLTGFYRKPECGGYYYPPADDAAAAAIEHYVAAHGRFPLCADTQWSLYQAGGAEGVPA